MRKASLAAAAALALLLARGARAEANLYAELGVGPAFAHIGHVSDSHGPNHGELLYENGSDMLRDLGWSGSGAIGVQFNRRSKHSFRVDVSGGYHRTEIDKLVVDGFALSHGGHTGISSAMLNGYYEHNFGDLAWFKAFIGAGLGVGFVEIAPGAASSRVQIDDSSAQLAFHGTVGLVLPLGDHVDLTAAYRYFGTTTPQLAAERHDLATGAVERGDVDVDVGISDVILGMRFTF
jgi:OmpA-OmpF porin, OOP family